MTRSERRRHWVITFAAMLPLLLLLLNSGLMLLVFGARLPPRFLHQIDPLSGNAVHDAARIVFATFVAVLGVVIVGEWRSAARNARQALTDGGGFGR